MSTFRENFGTGFAVRKPLWGGLGTTIKEAPSSADAIKIAGLDWNVNQEKLFLENDLPVEHYFANVRDSDRKVLGVVSEKYNIVQNREAFAFTDELLGQGVRYETAGCVASGKKVWMLARLEDRTITDELISPYLVFINSFDGSQAVRVAITPIRVICQNMLNLAIRRAERYWSCAHKGNILSKMDEARYTLLNTEKYLGELETEFETLKLNKFTDDKVVSLIDLLIPTDKYEDQDSRTVKRLKGAKEEIMYRYLYAPDLEGTDKSAFRFINAVSDFATHSEPARHTANYQENLFMKTVGGNNLIDKAYNIVMAA